MAGLMDAEGMFDIERAFRRDDRNCYNYSVKMVLTNTNIALMKWAVKHFGGVYKKRKPAAGKKQAYDWIISNQKHGLSFISQIFPFLVVKKTEAQTLVDYYAMYGKEFPERREQLFLKNKELKWDKSSVTTDMQDISNAYAAGFVDGDGSIDTPHRLSATNACKVLIDLFKATYGGSYYLDVREEPNQNDSHVWYLSNPEKVEKIVLSWLPYLIDKRQRGEQVLKRLRDKDTV
jgi:hypothetical protein